MLAIIAPGQGAQTPGMLAPWIEDGEAKDLLESWSDAIGVDLIHLGLHADADEIKDTANAQPLIVAAGLLSFRALNCQSFSFVAGHSVGEITAAVLAGILTPLDAMKLVAIRGREMAKAAALEPAGMSAVLGGDREVVLKAISEAGLVAANDNGAGQIVAAGSLEALATLAPEGARVRALAVAGAFHTSYMQSAVEPLRSIAQSIQVRTDHLGENDNKKSAIGVISNREGAVITDGREVLDRIVDQISNPVRWDLCMQTLANEGVTGVIELAPAGTLVGLIKRAQPLIEQFALKTPLEIPDGINFAQKHGGN